MNQKHLHFGLGTLLTVLLFLGSGAMGPAGILLLPLTLLPAMYVHMVHGLGAGGGIVLAVTVALLLLGNPAGALVYAVQFGVPAVVLPLLLHRGWAWDRAVAGALAVALGSLLIFLFAHAGASGVGLGEAVQRHIDTEMERAMAFYQQADLPEERLAELQSVAQGMADFLQRHYLGMTVIVTAALLLLAAVILAAAARGRYRIAGPPFHQWKLPEPTVWPLIAGGAGALLTDGWTQIVAMNLLVVLLPLYFLQGLAIITYFFRAKGFSPIFRALGYTLVTLLHPLPLIVAGLGVFDLWADFRRPRVKQQS